VVEHAPRIPHATPQPDFLPVCRRLTRLTRKYVRENAGSTDRCCSARCVKMSSVGSALPSPAILSKSAKTLSRGIGGGCHGAVESLVVQKNRADPRRRSSLVTPTLPGWCEGRPENGMRIGRDSDCNVLSLHVLEKALDFPRSVETDLRSRRRNIAQSCGARLIEACAVDAVIGPSVRFHLQAPAKARLYLYGHAHHAVLRVSLVWTITAGERGPPGVVRRSRCPERLLDTSQKACLVNLLAFHRLST
jgi:hypothetical protein